MTLGAGRTEIARYWDMAAVAQQERTPVTMQEAADGLEPLLRRAVGRRLVSDVPLGVFLSGGIDSAAVAALAQAQRTDPLKTFTVGFAEADYDEAADAAKVAAHLGCDHASLTVSAEEARACIPELPRWFDEPFADSSQIPTLLISRFARQSVTVALTGDGGDELFGGYNRYAFAARQWPLLRRLPVPARRFAAAVIAALPPRLWDWALGGFVRQAGEKAHKLAAVLPMDGPDEIYRRLTAQGVDAAGLVRGANEPPLDAASEAPASLDDAVERMQFMDTAGYLPDDILTKVDCASMAASLEARVPLLDHEVVEFAWRLPRHLKVGDGAGKRVLRAVLGRHVPAHLFAGRPKSGFAVPLDSWLRGPLREWAESLLSRKRLETDGLFDTALVRDWWDDHQSGAKNRQHALWNVLMFQAWYAEQ